jgi:virulence factor Mce-like protein
MTSSRRKSSIAANPVLIGAVTTLVLVVLVFLAYNANNGLPFVPSYDIKVEVPNAAGLVKGNEVRVGGTRVGVITKIEPQTEPDGAVVAVLTLKLNSVVEPVPDDTTVMIRPRSALGLKYVQLTRGPSKQGLPNGGTLAIAQARPEPVEIDEFFDMFDEPTRRASQANLAWFGNAISGRGVDLNLTIQELKPFAEAITPLMRNLSSERTDLAGFIKGLSQSSTVVAPVAETQAQMFVNLNTTFEALASVARPYIQESITEGPQTLENATVNLPRLRPFLANSATLWKALQPGIASFTDAAPDLASIVTVGTPVFESSPAFNAELSTTFTAVAAFATNPGTTLGVVDLTETMKVLRPTLAFVTPAQTTCNYLTLLLRNAGEIGSEGGSTGQAQRVTVIATPGGLFDPANPTTSQPISPNNEGVPASAPANGGPPGSDIANYLHSNPYPYTDAPGQPAGDCEAGRENYEVEKVVIGNPPGNEGSAGAFDSTGGGN